MTSTWPDETLAAIDAAEAPCWANGPAPPASGPCSPPP